MRFIDIIRELYDYLGNKNINQYSIKIVMNSSSDKDRLKRAIFLEGEEMQAFSDFRYHSFANIKLFGIPIEITNH